MNQTQMIALFCAGNGLPAPVPEWKFHTVRRWKFDLAWPALMVAFEVEGGVFTGGRHTRGRGFEADCEKYSVAATLGWKVIRATPGQIKRGEAFEWLQAALGGSAT